jgi:hypothetical protein
MKENTWLSKYWVLYREDVVVRLPFPMRRFHSWPASRRKAQRGQRPPFLEVLEDRCLLTTLNVGTNYNINQPSNSGSRAETSIAIDPTYPDDSRLFATSNPSNQDSGWFARYSTDGGVTWLASDVSQLPKSCCDQQVAFDQFGNLFVAYLTASGFNTTVALSTDDGQTFTNLGTLETNADQPSIATGPGGDYAPGSVWVDWTKGSNVHVKGAPVYGLGQVGSFGPVETATPGDYGSISVGPYGEVAVDSQTPTGGNGPGTVYEATDPSGLGFGGFSSQVVTGSNVGGFSPIPAQPQRTIDIEANMAYDQTTGRLYLAYVDRTATNTYDTDIYLRYSDDDGATWSDRVKVTDDFSGNSKFNDAIAVDQSTGFVAVTWYDCRNSPNNNTAQIYGTVSTDFGGTWEPNAQIGAGLSDGVKMGSFNFGDYDTMDYANGAFYRSWADNTNPSLLTPPNGHLNTPDPATARVDVIPDGPTIGMSARRQALAGHVNRLANIDGAALAATLTSNGALAPASASRVAGITSVLMGAQQLPLDPTGIDSVFATGGNATSNGGSSLLTGQVSGAPAGFLDSALEIENALSDATIFAPSL